ncbi:MAG: hypothetical protein QXU18_08535 [Thermoplasmatales archaeon]
MKALLIRKEKANIFRDTLLLKGIEFYEERDNFHFLFIFPRQDDFSEAGYKTSYLLDESVDEVEVSGTTFKIVGSHEAIANFANKFENRGLKAKMDNPDNLIEIKRWGSKYLVSVS